MLEPDNDIPIEAWNTVLFEKFVRFRHIMTTALSEHGDQALAGQPYAPGSSVLDIGCGFGDTTQAIARRVGPSGRAAGVDCAENFIALAQTEAQAAGLGNAAFFVADVQTDDLRGPYDHAFARFGTMFFNLPGAALRNIRRALKPGGDFCMVVWRKREDNPWVHDAETVAREMVPVVAHDETDQVHCGPGPFSMAGADMVGDLLKAAGFRRISFERFDVEIRIGADLDEAIAFAVALGPAGEIIRLAGAEGEKRMPQVIEALKATLKPHQRSDGSVWAGSSSWIVRAQNP
ncbi:MAG: class I SAM-dependent methyltransferase [Pseudomonadota bacterium]